MYYHSPCIKEIKIISQQKVCLLLAICLGKGDLHWTSEGKAYGLKWFSVEMFWPLTNL